MGVEVSVEAEKEAKDFYILSMEITFVSLGPALSVS